MRILPHNKTDFEDTSTLFFPHAIKAVKKAWMSRFINYTLSIIAFIVKNTDLRNQALKALSVLPLMQKKLPKLLIRK